METYQVSLPRVGRDLTSEISITKPARVLLLHRGLHGMSGKGVVKLSLCLRLRLFVLCNVLASETFQDRNILRSTRGNPVLQFTTSGTKP